MLHDVTVYRCPRVLVTVGVGDRKNVPGVHAQQVLAAGIHALRRVQQLRQHATMHGASV